MSRRLFAKTKGPVRHCLALTLEIVNVTGPAVSETDEFTLFHRTCLCRYAGVPRRMCNESIEFLHMLMTVGSTSVQISVTKGAFQQPQRIPHL